MKKQLAKPENWQDFESLCKKLWGEIWKIPNRIKKNGRTGQDQNGIDIYGIPKGETNYWGIQCKGKDEYTHAKITKKEIVEEIRKAKKFQPKLDVFILATTSNKDAKIEKEIRLLDIENRNAKSFEIVLFCWEDIVDLIEKNRNIYQYYVNNIQFKDRFDFEIFLEEGTMQKSIYPKFYRKLRKYYLKEGDLSLYNQILHSRLLGSRLGFSSTYESMFKNTNVAIVEINLEMKNTGSIVIEDWYILLRVIGQHKPINESRYIAGMPNFSFDTKTRTIKEKNAVQFRPQDNKPLVQNDRKNFSFEIIPLPEEYEIKIEWELIARDFQKKGSLTLNVIPEYKDEVDYKFVDDESLIKKTEILSIRENKYEENNL